MKQVPVVLPNNLINIELNLCTAQELFEKWLSFYCSKQ